MGDKKAQTKNQSVDSVVSPSVSKDKKSSGAGWRILLLLLCAVVVGLGIWAAVIVYQTKTTNEYETSVHGGQIQQDSTQDGISSTVCTKHDGVCIGVVSGWTADLTEDEYPARDSAMAEGLSDNQFVKVDRIEAKSADGSAVVNVRTGITGLGGVCSEGEGKNVHVINRKKTELPAADYINTKEDIYAVSLVYRGKDGNYRVYIGLSNNPTLTKESLDEAKDNCSIAYFGVVGGRGIDFSSLNGGTSSERSGSIFVSTAAQPSIDASQDVRSFASLDEAKNHLATSEMKQAFEMIASAKYNS